MTHVQALAVQAAKAPLLPFSIPRRDPGAHDVVIAIAYCGICHSDIHQARQEWGPAIFPMVPGHEIVGHVQAVGSAVQAFAPGQSVGVGCFVDACRRCEPCHSQQEQYCTDGVVSTYNSRERHSQAPTYGGYAKTIVVDEHFVLRVDPGADLARTAPLLCAGITTYAPLAHFGAGVGKRVGVMGLGGLGHMAVKIARAMGSEVCVLSTSAAKQADAKRLGATDFVLTGDKGAAKQVHRRFDLIINTIAAQHDLGAAIDGLKAGGTMVLLGVSPQPLALPPFGLIGQGRRLAGSLVGGLQQTQEMLDFCASHRIGADIEMCSAQAVNEAYARVVRNDVKYRFVIDLATL